ncbi:hypothetical protein BH11GEM1_BH11GEM1_00260 [soil metagenome]
MTIRALVERERQYLRRTEIAASGLAALSITLLLLTVGAVSLGRSRWLSLPRALPLAIWLLVIIALAVLAMQSRRRLRGRASRRDVALAIEQEQGMRRGALVGALELEGAGALAERAALRVRGTLPSGGPLAPAMRGASSRRASIGAGAAVAGALLLLSASPLFGDGLRAVLRPIDAWTGRLLARPRVVGVPGELLRGSPLRVRVSAPGRRLIYLDVRQTGDAWRTDTLAIDPATGVAAWTIDALRGDLRLVASDGRTTSDSVVVHAADRPFVGAVTLHAHYPAYLGRGDELLPVGEMLRLPRGSVLSVSGRASVPLTDVALVSAGGTRVALGAVGQSFSGQFVPDQSVQLRWAARGPGGLVPELPEPLDIIVVADSAPHVVIAQPVADTLLVSAEPVQFALMATDDHGIANVSMRITRTSARGAAAALDPVARGVGMSWSGTTSVDIAALHLAPGDAVTVRAEAVNASPWAQRGVSREVVLRRATSEEQRTAARALGDSAVKDALAAARDQKALAQRTDEAARAQARSGAAKDASGQGRQQKAPMNFESAEKARSLAQEQRAMADRVQKLRQATQQLEQQLKAAGALDTSLARQLGEAQALMRQALTPELLAQMQKLESSAQQMNGDQSRHALRDLAAMQQKMREQLERSAEMLKRAAHEGSMQTLGDEAKELAQKERALADPSRRTDATKTPPDAKEATALAQRAARLRDAMDELKSRLAKDKADAGASKTDEAGQHAAKSENELRRAANELKAEKGTDAAKREGESKAGDGKPGGDKKSGEGKTGESKSGGEQKAGQQGGQQASAAADEMDRAAKSMQEARSEQVKEWKQELTSELDQSVQEMMQLAREERSLEQKARSGASADERRSAQSAIEQGVEKASERLQGAGRKSALLSGRTQRAVADAKSKVSQATESVGQPNSSGQKQAGALGDAADALTKAAASLARDRERANNATSASGFDEMLKQMQQMAQQQGQINGQAQSLFNMQNGQSAAAQSLARALAQKQRQLAEQLEDAGDAAGGTRAAQLAQEARQLAEALDNGRLDGGTLARQQQLFRRLLDAGKSLEKEERDDTGKREAKSATGADAFSPNGKVDARAAVKFRAPTWQELRALSADERRAILDYFARLNGASAPAP